MTNKSQLLAEGVTARLGLRTPQDYGDAFHILGEYRILPIPLAERMMDMARCRNLLVHAHWMLDQDRVYDSLSGRLGTLEAFMMNVAQWMKEKDS